MVWHRRKKHQRNGSRLRLIIESGNDYVIAVKKNQPKLLARIQACAAHKRPISHYIETETTRNRVTTRKVEVFEPVKEIDPSSIGIKSLIRVERRGTRGGQPYHEIVCYISSLFCTAKEFACRIRRHWSIENRLHWIKDVVFQEDRSTRRKGNSPAKCSVLFAIALNLLRRNGYASITCAQRFIAHDLDKLFSLVE